ncbi:hypothetical protein [Phormidium sp. CCY1219]|uniref:hypothetical protein n=1 Tax=Phormidium sp. CCY1219 TaxID=2886104 RepID=UPI002D1F5E23|nr:hypothetical protein [Phormidium sp. CCY1219]MEB3829982.1 hypothetical protein [Phormidium sp. CCY1219]
MNLGDIGKLSEKATEQANAMAQGSAELSEQVVQMGVDRAITTVQNVVERIKESDIPVEDIDVKTDMNIGVVHLSMAFTVQLKDEQNNRTGLANFGNDSPGENPCLATGIFRQ